MNFIYSIANTRLTRSFFQRLDTSSSQNNPQLTSTNQRGRSTQISGKSSSSTNSTLPPRYANDEKIKTWIQLLDHQERNAYLHRACSNGLICKNFARKNIPPKHLIKWQEEELKKQVSDLNLKSLTSDGQVSIYDML